MAARSLLGPLILVSLCGALLRAQGVVPYPKAVTDTLIRQESPLPPPLVNTVFRDPDFGSLMVRTTDETTNSANPGSFLRTSARGSANEWNVDSSKFYVIGEGGWEYAFGFDPSVMKVSLLPGALPGEGLRLPLRIGSAFSFVDPDLIYGTTSKSPLTIAGYRFSTATSAPVIDTTTCGAQPPLVVDGHKVVSDDDITLSTDDSRMVISEGGKAAGGHMFVIVYDKKLGCRWFNTQTGEIGGQWGANGTASVQTRFTIFHTAISGDGRYVKIGVNHFGFYLWDVGTLNLAPCPDHGGPLCSAYGIMGREKYVNAAGTIDQINTLIRPLSDLSDISQLVYPLPTPYHFGQAKHFTWTTGNFDDTKPACASTYDYEGETDIDAPYDGEILCIETDGKASTVWRFAHNRAIWVDPYFNTQPLGNISPDGQFFLFTSGWDGQLGKDRFGNPRSDVWIVKLD